VSLEELILKHHGKDFTLNQLIEMVEQVVDSGLITEREPAPEKIQDKELSVTMPIIRISEKMWGKEGSQDREIIQKLLGRIVQYGTTLKDKIDLINDFLTNPPQTDDVSEILTNIVLLDTLTNIMVHFNASAAGFTFEGFLSALLSGQQVPAGTAGIQDLIDADDNPISLKLLTEKPGDVHGSYRDLVDHFIDPGAAKQDPESGQYVGSAGAEGKMTYVVALKSFREKEAGEKLKGKEYIRFFQFDFTAETFFESLVSNKNNVPLLLLPKDLNAAPEIGGEMETEQNVDFLSDEQVANLHGTSKKVYNYLVSVYDASYLNQVLPTIELKPSAGGKKMIIVSKETGEPLKRSDVELPPADPRRKQVAQRGHEGYRSYAESVNILKAALARNKNEFWTLISKTSGYTGAAGETQFIIGANYYKEKGYDKDGFGYVGIIYVGRQAVTELAERYADVLNQQIFDLFSKVQNLSEQINAYFVAGDKSEGIAAANTAGTIKSETEDYMKKTKS
tara:strand:+ start:742 stop:2262 length:1521 start_codon:yes stop_codon:yes gene_type:complete